MGLVMAKSIAKSSRTRIATRLSLMLLASLLVGCVARPKMLPTEQQIPIDRSLVVTPQGYALRPFVKNL